VCFTAKVTGLSRVVSATLPGSQREESEGPMSIKVASALLGALLSSAPALLGQTVTGSISGTVVDPDGSVIPGVSVTVASESTGALRETVTNDRGDFTFDALAPDVYTLIVQLSGFKRYEKRNVHVEPSDRLSVGQVQLQLGPTSEQVTVVAEGAKVQ